MMSCQLINPVRYYRVVIMEAFCVLCRAPLDNSSRRTVSPKSSSNERIINYILASVCPPGYQFLDGVQYLCRLNCYRKVEKAAKLHESLESLLPELKY